MREKSGFFKYLPLVAGSVICIVFWLCVRLVETANAEKLGKAATVIMVVAFIISHIVLNLIIIKRNLRSLLDIPRFFSFLQWVIPGLFLFIYGFLTIGTGSKGLLAFQVVFGVLFFVLGLFIPKIPYNNYGVGLKFPWILNNKEAWEITHKRSSVFWMLAGFVCWIFAFLPKNDLEIDLWVALFIICLIVIPLVISLQALTASKNNQ